MQLSMLDGDERIRAQEAGRERILLAAESARIIEDINRESARR